MRLAILKYSKGAFMISFYDDNITFESFPDIDDTLEFSSPETKWKLKKATRVLKRRPYIKSFIVTKNNKVIWEKYLNFGARNHCDNIHSVSKSILSAITGVAIEKGLFSLEDKVSDILPECPANNICVKHLLTMTGGLSWVEDHTEYKIEKTNNWVKSILSREMIHEPGEKFNYSSGLSHVLSAIIAKASGMSTEQFGQKHLFEKLKMSVVHWKQDPNDVHCGGFNFYMAPLDLVKFSLLYLNKGTYKGEQIIPKRWVEDSTDLIVETDGVFYGYYWWIDFMKGRKVYMAWGFGGQFIYIIPSLKMTVVITADTYHYSSEFNADYIVKRYIL